MAHPKKELDVKRIDKLCDKLAKINQPFTRPKTLNLMDKHLMNQKDMELTTAGWYDQPRHVDLFDLNLS